LQELLDEFNRREEDVHIISRTIIYLTGTKSGPTSILKKKSKSAKAALALKQDIEEGITFFSETKALEDFLAFGLDDGIEF
jgi:hypothetical protein